MPDNPLRRDAGNKIRALQLLGYFASRSSDLEVDFVSEWSWGQWDQSQIVRFEQQFPSIAIHVFNRKASKRNILHYFFTYKLIDYVRKHKWLLCSAQIPDRSTHILEKHFNRLLSKKKYDDIIISYVEWAGLIKRIAGTEHARLIVDTHDFITVQQKDRKRFNLGKAFAEEMALIRRFHESWSVSTDELYVFSQFAENTIHRFIPAMFEQPEDIVSDHCNFDILYISSENPHNRKGAEWFFQKVYPLISDALSILVIGKIVDYIPNGLPNVIKHRFVADVAPFYQQSRIVICPMLSGSGVKIKVVEALSFGRPVVSTWRGIDGLPQKTCNGCLVADTPSGFATHIGRLLDDEETYIQLGKQAKQLVEAHFSKTTVYRKLDEVFVVNHNS